MIAFRCSRCSKINISIEGYRCMHCGSENQVPLIPENQTEVSTLGRSNNISMHMQNKYSVSDFGALPQVSGKLHAGGVKEKDIETQNANLSHILLSQEPVRLGTQSSEKLNATLYASEVKVVESRNANFSRFPLSKKPVMLETRASEKLNTAKLHAIDEKDTEAQNATFSHVLLPHEEPVRPVTQTSNLKEMLISPSPTVCSSTFCSVDDGKNYPSTKCGVSEPTNKLQHISEQSSLYKSKRNSKKSIKHNKDAKSMQNENIVRKLNLGSSRSISTEKSVMNSFTKYKRKANYTRPRKSRNTTIKNNLQDDLKITNAFPHHSTCPLPEVSSKGCIRNDLEGKLPIARDRIKTPILKNLFLCNKCGKAFTDESKLKVHSLNHFKEKRFKCDKCNKAYFSEAHLKRHFKAHLDKGPFKCELCSLVFNRNCHLSLHRKKHISEPCPSVDTSIHQRKMGQPSQLREPETSLDGNPQKHSQTSTEDKFFLCTECGVKWARESDFHAHSLRHNVQNPFKCKKCNKEFRYELDLDRHDRVHSQERPFTCKICNFSSTLETNLKKHLEMHV